MQKILFGFIAALFLLSSCRTSVTPVEDPESPVGKWALTEVFISPGAGGSWNAVESSVEMEFFKNGRFKANSNLCNLSLVADENTKGTYDTETFELTTNRCPDDYQLRYQLDEVGNLLIYYPCIEPCIHKFVRIE